MDPKYQPTKQEQDFYYYGFPSRPTLIARSSTFPWSPSPYTPLKDLYAVESHPLISLWNDRHSSLRHEIQTALASLPWVALDILKFGWAQSPEVQEHLPEAQRGQLPNVTLMVAVSSMIPWNDAIGPAVRCHQIFARYNSDIHCEIRHSSVVGLAAGIEHNPVQLRSYSPLLFQRSTFLGTSLATAAHPQLRGTKGLYLRVICPDKTTCIAALTCRHVIEPIEGSSRACISRSVGRAVVQPAHIVVSERLDEVQTNIKLFQNHLEKYPNIASYETACRELRDEVGMLQNLETPESRHIGEVLYAAPYELVQTETSSWLSDWALVKLNAENHDFPLETITNTVFFGSGEIIRLLSRAYDEVKISPYSDLSLHLPLNGTIHESKLYKPSYIATDVENALIVGKIGHTTKLTIGISNAFKSVVRRHHPEIQGFSEEWCILGIRGKNGKRLGFSEPGDSGAIVWTPHGRVAGMVTSGVGDEHSHDVTYATPWERLAGHMKAQGYSVEIL